MDFRVLSVRDVCESGIGIRCVRMVSDVYDVACVNV